ncbi:MAG: hypothetical protein LBM13_02405 [Candidatus Ancillula sp.]|jgi:CobQ-like glutamine amidotransferase family enzyme|nr:hypothetical protein [Candidatus Ancillula sp.]
MDNANIPDYAFNILDYTWVIFQKLSPVDKVNGLNADAIILKKRMNLYGLKVKVISGQSIKKENIDIILKSGGEGPKLVRNPKLADQIILDAIEHRAGYRVNLQSDTVDELDHMIEKTIGEVE